MNLSSPNLKGLVAEEINLLETIADNLCQTESLVPAVGKHIEADLSADRIHQIVVWEILLELFDELLPNFVLLLGQLSPLKPAQTRHGFNFPPYFVILFELISFWLSATSSGWSYIDQTAPHFDKSSS